MAGKVDARVGQGKHAGNRETQGGQGVEGAREGGREREREGDRLFGDYRNERRTPSRVRS